MQTDILKNIKNYTKDTDPGPFSKNNGFLYNLELNGILLSQFFLINENTLWHKFP